MTAHRPVRLRESLARMCLGSFRQWGLPTGSYVGKVFWTELPDGFSMTCGVPLGRDRIRWECRRLVFVDDPAGEWLPAHWRRSMARYVKQWPSSGHQIARLALLSEAERAALIRDAAVMILDQHNASDVSALVLAHRMGDMASMYPIYREEFPRSCEEAA